MPNIHHRLSWRQLETHCTWCREAVQLLEHGVADRESGILLTLLLEHELNDEERRDFYRRFVMKLRRDRGWPT